MSIATTTQLMFDYGDLPERDIKRCEASVEKIDTFQRRMASDIIAVGKELLAVKEALPHGQFGPWLKFHFGWSQPTASRMMQAAATFKSFNLNNLTIDQSALYLLSSDKCDDDTREELIERAVQGERISHAIVKEALTAEYNEVLPPPLASDDDMDEEEYDDPTDDEVDESPLPTQLPTPTAVEDHPPTQPWPTENDQQEEPDSTQRTSDWDLQECFDAIRRESLRWWRKCPKDKIPELVGVLNTIATSFMGGKRASDK